MALDINVSLFTSLHIRMEAPASNRVWDKDNQLFWSFCPVFCIAWSVEQCLKIFMITRIVWQQHSEDCTTSADEMLLPALAPVLSHVAAAHMLKMFAGYHKKSSTDIAHSDVDQNSHDFSFCNIDMCSREYAQLRIVSISANSQLLKSCLWSVRPSAEDSWLRTRLQD